MPVITITLLCLASGNFRRLSETWRLWRRNILGVAAGLVFSVTCTAGIYHRAWEFLTPLEPAHGPARLTRAKPVALHSDSGNTIGVLLPDGRLWMDWLVYDPGWRVMPSVQSEWLRFGWKWTIQSGNHFVEGSNWVDASDGLANVGIRSDGTLWVSGQPRSWKDVRPGVAGGPDRLVQFGSETNWLR